MRGVEHEGFVFVLPHPALGIFLYFRGILKATAQMFCFFSFLFSFHIMGMFGNFGAWRILFIMLFNFV